LSASPLTLAAFPGDGLVLAISYTLMWVALFGSTAIAVLTLFTSAGLTAGTRVTLHCRIGGP